MTTIKRAVEMDTEQLAVLFDSYRIFYKRDTDIIKAIQFLNQRIGQQESVIFIAWSENVMLGFTQLYPLFSSLNMKRSWLLNDLFVLEQYRGKGISKLLINAAKELARETHAAGLMLETEKTNITGNKLYPSQGFCLYEKNNFYWWEND